MFWCSFTFYWKQDVNLTYVISLMNVHFKFYTQGITVWKYKITFLGKVRIITKQCHTKKNINKLKFSWRKSLTKKSSLLQLPTPHQSTVSAGSIKNYHRLFLYSSCLKRLRSTNLSSYPHVYWLLLFIIVFAHGSNILKPQSNFLAF